MRAPIRVSLFLSLAALSLPLAAQEGNKTIVLRGAKVYPVTQSPIENGVVVIQAGKILAIGGPDTEVPAGAEEVDCKGKVITPGLVDAGTQLAVSEKHANEQSEEVTPHMRISDAVEANHKAFVRVRRGGVTTVQVNPGNKNVIGGLGAVLKTHGASVPAMILKQDSGLRVTLGSAPGTGNQEVRRGQPNSIYFRRPTTRMGTVWMLRKAFYDAMDYRDQKTIDPNDPPPVDPAMEVLVRALEGELTVHTTARAEADIRTALRIAKEFGYKTVIQGGTETYKVIDDVAEAQAAVIFTPPTLSTTRDRDGAEGRLNTLELMAARDIRFAIKTEAKVGERILSQEAMVAMRNGLSFDKTLAAVTLVPAQLLGVEDRVGSLQQGRDADLVVWSGQPFQATTKAERVYVSGRSAPLR